MTTTDTDFETWADTAFSVEQNEARRAEHARQTAAVRDFVANHVETTDRNGSRVWVPVNGWTFKNHGSVKTAQRAGAHSSTVRRAPQKASAEYQNAVDRAVAVARARREREKAARAAAKRAAQ
jgi:hypothetical protein